MRCSNLSKLHSNQSVTCVVYGKTTISTTGDNPSQTTIIKPCTINCGCYIRGHGIWCNHCVYVYEVVEEITNHNPNLPLGALMGICMRQLRGKCSGVLCEKFIRVLTERRNGNP